MSRMLLHADGVAAVDWDWTVVIVGLYVEWTSTDDTVDVEKTSVNGVAVNALLGVNVVEDIEELVNVDCFDDVAVDVDNVEVVVDRADWVVEGRIRSPLQMRVKTTSAI